MSWRIVPGPGGGGTLNGITCDRDGACWAVGEHRGAFGAGSRAGLNQTLVVGTIDVDHGIGEHTRPDPAADESWVARYNGQPAVGRPAHRTRPPGYGPGRDIANALAVSPDGSRIFLSGESSSPDNGHSDFATVAYPAGPAPSPRG